MNLLEAASDTLYCSDAGFVHDSAVRVTQGVGAAMNFAHGGVIGSVIDEMNFVALGFESGFDSLVKTGYMCSRNDEVVSYYEKIHYAGEKSVATFGIGCTVTFEK